MRRWTVAVAAAGVAVASVAAGTPQVAAAPVAAGQRAVVAGRPALPRGAEPVGRLPGSVRLRVVVGLKPRDPAGLAALANAVSDPRSPLYRHFLTEPQFVARFAPPEPTVRSLTRYLGSVGLGHPQVSGNRMTVGYLAPASAVERAFAVRFAEFRSPAERKFFAPTGPPSLPLRLAAAVRGVVGLDDLAGPATAPPTGRNRPGAGTSSSRDAPGSTYSYPQLKTAYGFAKLASNGYATSGAGQHVGLIDWTAPSKQ